MCENLLKMTTPNEEPVSASSTLTEPRDDIINTAVKFLKNPHVSKSPLAKSQQFLRSKGLTDREIQLACEKSGAYNIYSDKQIPNLPASLPIHQMYHQGPQSLFLRVRDTLHSVALFSGLIYAVYLFYKKFIRPWLFGDTKKKSIEESVADLEKNVTVSISELKDNISDVSDQIDGIRDNSTLRHLQELKTEINSVKGLLLSRKQFPSVSGNLVPPSIPAWQLSSAQAEVDGKAEELMEIGSGSGSSETEVVTKNSDSSLEIM